MIAFLARKGLRSTWALDHFAAPPGNATATGRKGVCARGGALEPLGLKGVLGLARYVAGEWQNGAESRIRIIASLFDKEPPKYDLIQWGAAGACSPRIIRSMLRLGSLGAAAAARQPAAARARAFFVHDRRQPHGDDRGGALERRRGADSRERCGLLLTCKQLLAAYEQLLHAREPVRENAVLM